jgi:hypothetical protein
MLSDTYTPFMLSFVILNVGMLSAVALLGEGYYHSFENNVSICLMGRVRCQYGFELPCQANQDALVQ